MREAGRAWADGGPTAVAGRKREELGDEPARYAEIRQGCWDVDARIEDMNANGTFMPIKFGTLATMNCSLSAAEMDY